MKKKVKILGVGSIGEQQLVAEVQSVARQLNLEVDIEQINDIELFLQIHLPAIPALVVGDRMVSNGRLPAREEIAGWLRST